MMLKGEEEYEALTESETNLGNLHINEISIHILKALTLEFHNDTLTISATDTKTQFRLVRKKKCLVINEEIPEFRASCDIEDSFIGEQQRKNREDMDAYLAALDEYRERQVAEARRQHDTRYDETKMVYRTSWQLRGSALDVRFFNLNTPECTITVHNKRSSFLPLQNRGIILAPHSSAYIKKGVKQVDQEETVYSCVDRLSAC